MMHLQLLQYLGISNDVITIVGINNDEVNIKSDGCVSLTQLQRKWLQHLNDMFLETNILLQKIKQDHFYLHVFCRGIINLFGVGGYISKCLETSFLDKSF